MVRPDPNAELIKGATLRSCGWIHGPCNLELLAAALRRLHKISAMQGRAVSQVEKVHATLIKGTKLVAIQPAPSTDLSGIPVTRYDGNSTAWINLFTLLGPAELTVETGYQEKFEVAFIPKGSPLWPGLFIDLSKPTERKKSVGKKEN